VRGGGREIPDDTQFTRVVGRSWKRGKRAVHRIEGLTCGSPSGLLSEAINFGTRGGVKTQPSRLKSAERMSSCACAGWTAASLYGEELIALHWQAPGALPNHRWASTMSATATALCIHSTVAGVLRIMLQRLKCCNPTCCWLAVGCSGHGGRDSHPGLAYIHRLTMHTTLNITQRHEQIARAVNSILLNRHRPRYRDSVTVP
jgi:hypothetical protein